ncbi:MAG: bifunctional indole-3-glycerol-phosphate synthase TrpC/phosphoribosylanthranilate isomerase TrpF [Saccharofermentanales bacterium]
MILDEIVKATHKRVEESKKIVSAIEMRRRAQKSLRPFVFESVLKKSGVSFICEVKKASPSKGVISTDFDYIEIALDYQKSGADAISVLTEPEFFMGDMEYLKKIREAVRIPVLQKDFIVDEYQIYQASIYKADAILLICSILEIGKLAEFIKKADSLGISCLVETHDENEIDIARKAGARIIGVNNRNLKTMEVDIGKSRDLRRSVPDGIIFVSESGIRTPEDIGMLRGISADAVLIGETLMKCEDIGRKMTELRKSETKKVTKIKICGIRSFKDVEYVNEAMPDYAGFVFAKSRRIVDFDRAYLLKSELDKQIKVVGVFAGEEIEFIKKCCECGVIDIVQLHGDEDNEYIKRLKKTVFKPLIKAVKINPDIDNPSIEDFDDADFILFDTFDANSKGGTGKSFEWRKIAGFKNPFFLAGGLNCGNIIDAIEIAHPYCIDISSGVETDGVKDRQKIIDAVNLVRSVK